METYKKGDKLKCTKTIKGAFGPLFIEGNIYEVLHVVKTAVLSDDDPTPPICITLNHILYEYVDLEIDFVNENFKSISEIREDKLNQIL
jgi:hypothetical protein